MFNTLWSNAEDERAYDSTTPHGSRTPAPNQQTPGDPMDLDRMQLRGTRVTLLEKEYREKNALCKRCGGSGHFAKNCNDQLARQSSRTYNSADLATRGGGGGRGGYQGSYQSYQGAHQDHQGYSQGQYYRQPQSRPQYPQYPPRGVAERGGRGGRGGYAGHLRAFDTPDDYGSRASTPPALPPDHYAPDYSRDYSRPQHFEPGYIVGEVVTDSSSHYHAREGPTYSARSQGNGQPQQ
jgi:hypothetical protein